MFSISVRPFLAAKLGMDTQAWDIWIDFEKIECPGDK